MCQGEREGRQRDGELEREGGQRNGEGEGARDAMRCEFVWIFLQVSSVSKKSLEKARSHEKRTWMKGLINSELSASCGGNVNQ